MIQMNDKMKIEDMLLTNIEGAQQRGTSQQWPKQSTYGLKLSVIFFKVCTAYYAAENQLKFDIFCQNLCFTK